MNVSTIKQPSAFIPLVMSLAALAIVLGHVALFGAAREADEGTAAHLWPLLMPGQLPIVAFFALKWLPRTPKQALLVLALQSVAGLVAITPLSLLNLYHRTTRDSSPPRLNHVFTEDAQMCRPPH